MWVRGRLNRANDDAQRIGVTSRMRHSLCVFRMMWIADFGRNGSAIPDEVDRFPSMCPQSLESSTGS